MFLKAPDFNKLVPMARPGTVEEIANVTLFLASVKASYVTGACVPIDGGMSSNPLVF